MNILGLKIGSKKSFTPTTTPEKMGSSIWYSLADEYNGELSSVETQLQAYNKCGWLQVILQKKLQYSLNGKLYFTNTKGETVENIETKRHIDFLNKPNIYQNGEQFITWLELFKGIFGKAYVYRPETISKSINVAYVIPNWMITPNYVYGKFETALAINKTEFTESYTININGKVWNVKPSEILLYNDTTINTTISQYAQLFDGQSRMIGLSENILNINACYEVRGRLIRSGGAIGIISPDAKGDIGTAGVLSDKDTNVIQDRFNSMYGLLKKKFMYVFSPKPVKFVSLSKNVDDLKLFEEIEDDVRILAQAYGIDLKILGFTSAKYNNMQEAEKSMYQNTTIPEASQRASFLNILLGLNGIYINYDFSHVEVLQASEAEKQAAEKANTDKNLSLFNNNFITYNQFLESIDLPKVDGMDKYSYQLNNLPLAQRIGVGGVQSFTAIIADPMLTTDVKKETLKLLFGLTEEEVNPLFAAI